MSLLNNLFGSGTQQALLGTSEDEMYRQHIDHLRAHEDELLRQKYAMQAQMQISQSQNAYTKNLAQSMMNAKQGVVQGIMSQGAQAIPFNPNDIEAYKVPLSTLVTLWQAKFGDEWTQKFDDEEFWFDAMFRLKAAGKLEEAKHTWYRIKEDA